jgi:hypothetical protein
MQNAVVRADAAITQPNDFDFSSFRIFTSVPDHRDYGIVALRGMVVIYDERPLHQEGIVAGAFYVKESQRPRSGMMWESWLLRENEDQRRRCGPAGPLAIQREVVQAVHWPHAGDWSVRLPSGFVDGPYCDWVFGTDFIGKVVGIYLPTASSGEC